MKTRIGLILVLLCGISGLATGYDVTRGADGEAGDEGPTLIDYSSHKAFVSQLPCRQVTYPGSTNPDGGVTECLGDSMTTVAADYCYPGANQILCRDYQGAVGQTSFQPSLVGAVTGLTWATGHTILWPYAYVSSATGFDVLDVTVAGTPVLLRNVNTTSHGGAPITFDTDGRYLYGLAYDSGATHYWILVYDLLYPGFPVYAGATEITSHVTNPNMVRVQGKYLHVVSGGYAPSLPAHLAVFDVTVPGTPTYKGRVAIDNNSRALDVMGGLAYVVGNQEAGVWHLRIINATSDPAAPTIIGTVSVANAMYTVRVMGRYAVAAGTHLYVFDVANPAAPAVVGSPIAVGSVYHSWLAGNYLYLTDQTDDAVKIFDLANPSAPVLASQLNGIASDPYAIRVVGRYGYVSSMSGVGAGTFAVMLLGGGVVANAAEFGSIRVGKIQSNNIDVQERGTFASILVGPTGIASRGPIIATNITATPTPSMIPVAGPNTNTASGTGTDVLLNGWVTPGSLVAGANVGLTVITSSGTATGTATAPSIGSRQTGTISVTGINTCTATVTANTLLKSNGSCAVAARVTDDGTTVQAATKDFSVTSSGGHVWSHASMTSGDYLAGMYFDTPTTSIGFASYGTYNTSFLGFTTVGMNYVYGYTGPLAVGTRLNETLYFSANSTQRAAITGTTSIFNSPFTVVNGSSATIFGVTNGMRSLVAPIEMTGVTDAAFPKIIGDSGASGVARLDLWSASTADAGIRNWSIRGDNVVFGDECFLVSSTRGGNPTTKVMCMRTDGSMLVYTGPITVGTAGGTAGAVKLLGSTSGSIQVQAAASGGNTILVMPTTAPSAGQALVASAVSTSTGTSTATMTWASVADTTHTHTVTSVSGAVGGTGTANRLAGWSSTTAIEASGVSYNVGSIGPAGGSGSLGFTSANGQWENLRLTGSVDWYSPSSGSCASGHCSADVQKNSVSCSGKTKVNAVDGQITYCTDATPSDIGAMPVGEIHVGAVKSTTRTTDTSTTGSDWANAVDAQDWASMGIAIGDRLTCHGAISGSVHTGGKMRIHMTRDASTYSRAYIASTNDDYQAINLSGIFSYAFSAVPTTISVYLEYKPYSSSDTFYINAGYSEENTAWLYCELVKGGL